MIKLGHRNRLIVASWFLISVIASVTAWPGDAAELRVDPSDPSARTMVFEGKIEAGDFERVTKFIIDSGQITKIYLASPGGDLAEAVKIGLLVRHLKLATIVPSKQLTQSDRGAALARHGLKDNKDYLCTSACFFIFIAGIYRSADDHGSPILGIHSPTLIASAAAKLGAAQANTTIARARKVIADYFSAMDVPIKYTEEVDAVPRTKMRWIRNDEFQSDFAGFIPELRTLVKTKCGNGFNAVDRNTQKQEQCESEVRSDLAVAAFKAVVKAPSGESPPLMFHIAPQGQPN